MKLKLIIFISIFCITQISFGQGGFSKNYFLNNTVTSVCLDALETPNGNLLAIGVSNNGVNNVLKILATDGLGNKLWEKSYGNLKFEYLADQIETRCVAKFDNELYLFRTVRDSNNNYLATFIKFNYDGDTLWQKKYYENNKYLIIRAATKSIDGGFFLTGVCYNNGNYYSMFILKTDVNGNELWRKFYSKPIAPYFIEPVKAIQDITSKRLFLIGNQFIYDGHFEQGYSNYGTVFLFDSLGNYLNSKYFGGNCGGAFTDGMQTKDKQFIAVGYNDQCNNLGSRRFKSYAIKFNHNLQPIFTKEYDTLSIYNQFTSLQEYDNGDLLISGHYDTLNNYNLNPKYSLRLIKTDKNGFVKKRRYYFGSGISPANAKLTKSLHFLGNGGAIVAYWLAQKPGGMPFSLTVVDSNLCDTSAFYCATVGIKENSYQAADVSIYPQPSNQTVNLSSPLFANKSAQLQISNNLGQLCYNQNVKFNNGNVQIPLGDLPKGIYLLKLIDEDFKTYTQKLIVE